MNKDGEFKARLLNVKSELINTTRHERGTKKKNLSPRQESKSARRGVRDVMVSIPVGDSDFFLCPTLLPC